MSARPLHAMQSRRFERGSAAIEFALVATVGGLLLVLFGTLELGRLMFTLNTATEATRLGARIAVVCNADDAQIKTRMAAMLPLLTPENIAVTYQPAGCASSADDARNTCASVTVAVHSGVRFNSVIPLVPINLDLPAFATTLPREAMDSASCRN